MKANPVLFLLLLAFLLPLQAATLRWNQAGYSVEGRKILVIMDGTDLSGQEWVVEKVEANPETHGAGVLHGRIGARLCGAGDHSPFAFNHAVDLSALKTPGSYRFRLGRDEALLRISVSPYARFIPEALRHLRMVRSGESVAPPRKPSHLGDRRAVVYLPAGAVSQGKWRKADPARVVDVSGAWYDAGDQIKFTLNIAYTSYHLLYAYRLNPALHSVDRGGMDMPAVLAEARHGLEFLCRVFPDPETFVIQVGDEGDHDQALRLPENDALDGKRPALCALSRTHMASAAAALSLGSRTFAELGRADDAKRYRQAALAIFKRTQEPGTVATAFERGEVNDFYNDPSEVDQMSLAASELLALTGDETYLALARNHAAPASPEVSWANWHWIANANLAAHDAAARGRLVEEARGYARHGSGKGAPWGIPGRYVWGSLHRWVGAANACRIASWHAGGDRELDDAFFAMRDYVFGTNNWGVSFLFTRNLPNAVQHLYSPMYDFLKLYPTGALSEGPGDQETHATLDRYFKIPPDDPLLRFNTKAGVFHDNASDFMCQEATIGGQADLILMLTLASP